MTVTTRYRVVIDTSTFISAAITGGIPAAVLDTVYMREYTLLFSFETYNELYEVLHRPKFNRYVDLGERRKFLESVQEVAEWVSVSSNIRMCRDSKDDKFLAVALDGKADYVISSDQDLYGLERFKSIPIPAPREFYDTVLFQ